MSYWDNLETRISLNNILEKDSLKWIFVGGKGGVGKTTISSVIAVELAKIKKNVLLLSTDPASNISDTFSQKFSDTPKLIDGFDNLYAMEFNLDIKKNEYSQSIFKTGMLSKVIEDIASSIPGIDEALSFSELINSVTKMDYSVIVFDTAPTGHTLRFLNLPTVLEKGVDLFLKFKDNMSGLFSIMSNITGQSLDDDLYSKFDLMKALISSVKSTLENPDHTTFICVCIPEFSSIYETERLVQALLRCGIDVSNIVVNQVLYPLDFFIKSQDTVNTIDVVNDTTISNEENQYIITVKHLQNKLKMYEDHYSSRRKMQSKYIKQIIDLYAKDFYITPVPLNSIEIRGVQDISKFSTYIFDSNELPTID